LPALLEERPARFDRGLNDRNQARARLLHLDDAAADPRDVEQIIDQTHHVLELPIHHRQRATKLFQRWLGPQQQIEPHANRR
jgi:hypothetical protein